MGFYVLTFSILCFCCGVVLPLNNGLARTPPMGWMSWGYYMCGVDCEKQPEKCLDEKLILSVTDTFYNEGYQEAGYEYIIIDDCWSERHRDSHGRLVPDRKRFPRGMKYIADYIHSRGLKFGMYTNVAKQTCMHYPGSRGFFSKDVKTLAQWDIDYLKVDGCFVEEDFLNTAYIELGNYLNRTGRPIVYSCSWPYYIKFIHNHEPDLPAVAKHCNLWRNYHDVFINWQSVKNIIQYYESQAPSLKKIHGPGQWNDPDMLIYGTGVLTEGQSRIQLSVYTMLSAPLLLSCDMKRITPFEKKLLLNLDLVAIGQDVLGEMATPYKMADSMTLWVKWHIPIKGNVYHSFSFALVNMGPTESSVSFVPEEYGPYSNDSYTVLDIFTSKFIKNVTKGERLEVTVPSEDAVLYTLYPL